MRCYIRGIIFGLICLGVNSAEGGVHYNPLNRQLYPYSLSYRQPYNVLLRDGIHKLNTSPQTSGITPINGALLRPEVDLSIPGRGLDLTITRWYNSKIWQQWDHYRTYNWGWFAPFLVPYTPTGIGWDLHMGKIHYDTTSKNFIYEAPGGSTYELKKKSDSIYVSTGISAFEYNDSTKIMVAKEGSRYFFSDEPFPFMDARVTKIQEPNGNYILITYKNMVYSPGDGVVIDSIIDDCNRTMKFHYSYFLTPAPCSMEPKYAVLDSITYKGLNGENLAIRYHYKADTITSNPLAPDEPFKFCCSISADYWISCDTLTIPYFSSVVYPNGDSVTYQYNDSLELVRIITANEGKIEYEYSTYEYRFPTEWDYPPFGPDH